MKKISAFLGIFLFVFSMAAQADLVEGKDYQSITPSPHAAKLADANQVQVTEFFSLGCPACYRLEPYLENWLAHSKPNNVVFSRVPVAFREDWTALSRDYYVARELGVENKMVPILFNAFHEKQMDLKDKAVVEKLFISAGVSKETFDDAYDASPAIDLALNQGATLLSDYQILVIPTIVVGNRYRTDLSMAGGNPKQMLAIVDQLITMASHS